MKEHAEAEALKAQVRLEEVIEASSDIRLEGHGRYRRAREHDSLVVDTQTGFYNWNSRGEAGDVFTWLQLHGRMTFPEACQALASGQYGRVTLPADAPAPEPPLVLPQDLHLRYHRSLDAEARAWWHGQGINDAAIARFFLGVCDFHPLYRQTTYTIPVIEAGQLLNVRHRLAAAQSARDKYRPERAGIGAALFNADILTPDLTGVVVVAGEKKVIVLWQHGIPAVSSTAGCGHWTAAFTTRLQFCQRAYIAFDPGESTAAWKLAEQIGERAFVAALPAKPDDFITAEGAQAFRRCLREAEPYADRDYWWRQLDGRSPWGRLLP